MRILRKWLSVLCCIVLDVMIPWPNILKRKWVFMENEKGFLGYFGFRGSIVRVLTYCDFAKRVMRQRLGCGPWVFVLFIMRLCANVFGVGPKSDGEALTDRWFRPRG